MGERITLSVTVNKPLTGAVPVDMVKHVQGLLDTWIPHYEPTVTAVEEAVLVSEADAYEEYVPRPAQPGDRCQILGDGYTRHWDPCDEFRDGQVTDIRGRVLDDLEAGQVVQRWLDKHN